MHHTQHMQESLGEQPERDDIKPEVTSQAIKRRSTLRYMRRSSKDVDPNANERLQALMAALDAVRELQAHESDRQRVGTATAQRLEALRELTQASSRTRRPTASSLSATMPPSKTRPLTSPWCRPQRVAASAPPRPCHEVITMSCLIGLALGAGRTVRCLADGRVTSATVTAARLGTGSGSVESGWRDERTNKRRRVTVFVHL